MTTLVLSLEARLSEMTSELLETKRERDEARAALEASAARDPNDGASDRVTELVQTFDHEVSGLLRDAEVEAERLRSDVRMEADRILALAREEAKRFLAEADAEAEQIRADARMQERESQIRAGRLIVEAREEADRAESHLGTVRGRVLDTFRDIRERTIAALGEVEAVIESGANSDRVVIVDEAVELVGAIPRRSLPTTSPGSLPPTFRRLRDRIVGGGVRTRVRCDRGVFGNLSRRAEEDPKPTAREAASASRGRAPAAPAQASGDDDRGRARDRARGRGDRLRRVHGRRHAGGSLRRDRNHRPTHRATGATASTNTVEPQPGPDQVACGGTEPEGRHEAEAAVLGARAGRQGGDHLHGGDADLVRHDRDRASGRPGAGDRELVRLSRAEGLLRRAAVPPPRHVDRRDPGRRPDGHRVRRARVLDPRRAHRG